MSNKLLGLSIILGGNLVGGNIATLKPVRLDSIDIIRGLAIALMVFTHFYAYTVYDIHDSVPAILNEFASFLSVPLFYFIVGYTLVISINDKTRKGYSKDELMNYVLVRAILICALGFALGIFQKGMYNGWEWGTLQMIAVGYLCTYFLLPLSKEIRTIIATAAILFAFFLAPYSSFYQYTGGFNISIFFLGIIFAGGFPFFPWIAYFILGSVFADIAFTKKNVVMIGFPLTILSIISFIYRRYNPIIKYPASLTYNIIWITGTILVYFTIYWVREIKNAGKTIFYPLKVFGMFSLTIFIAHFVIGMSLIELFITSDSLSFTQFLCIYILSFIIITIIGHFWQRTGFKYSIEWFLQIVSYKALQKRGPLQKIP